MNVFLSHLPLAPLIYGGILAASMLMYRWMWSTGQYMHLVCSAGVLMLLFSMHGEAADTRMGAAIAVLIVDILLSLKRLFSR